MSIENAVTEHYHHGSLLNAIETALVSAGKQISALSVTDLAPVDEFHIGGRAATENLLQQLGFTEQDHVLDVGCGLGGGARYTAHHLGCRVTGIDLTTEYVETGGQLSEWVGLQHLVALISGSALEMPFSDGCFDGGYMLHVGMNIEDKARLFAEISRVLRPGRVFGIYDIMQIRQGQPTYPVPWATSMDTSYLATVEQYRQALDAAGFDWVSVNHRRDFALKFFDELLARTNDMTGLPALGLHTLIGDSMAEKFRNMISAVREGILAPVEIVVRKPD
ncbi:SAM-dependent methyltransferase [Hahella sp. CCB-MM4]|uniref:class I SAM-dependent methyltransferase n=1 Tax=Hahella sp. (strain CCB-MM4) TaxID=1926491 RepID=UPI000B9AD952|nr:methyltransferase domain-containing protein [Hahella sp. CCB-MM4]OZG70165.1 SAM-dependent methyltransferase [Hahella sp. CCB-MM4]